MTQLAFTIGTPIFSVKSNRLQVVPKTCTTKSSNHDNIRNGIRMTTNPVEKSMSRRAFIFAACTTTAMATKLLQPATVSAKSNLSGDYSVDARALLTDMRTACDLARGTPGMSDTVGKTRREMNDFVALYRRNNKVSGSTSFSTLYTAINTLSGHYASYGNAYPVPDKRKKRLSQQFSEVDRALNRGR